MSGYIGPAPVPQATQTREAFTATSGQTTFNTGGYTAGYIDVFMNGVKLAAADYTATNGSDVVLASGAATGDIIETVAYSAFTVADQDFTGDLTVDGDTFVVDSTNNRVGIGTSSPAQKLHVSTPSGNAYVRVERANQTTGQVGVQIGGGTSSTDWFTYMPASSDDLAFFGNSQERMRIDTSGNLLVGATSVDFQAKNYVVSSLNAIAAKTTAPANTYEAFVGARDGNAGKIATWWYNSGSQVGNISITSSSTSYNTSSDYRLKTDAQPITGASARVQALNPVNFEWIADGTRVDGFLAHEAQQVVPEAVTGTKDAVDADGNPEYQGIDQSKLVPLLTAALQEALTEIADLKARVTNLEG